MFRFLNIQMSLLNIDPSGSSCKLKAIILYYIISSYPFPFFPIVNLRQYSVPCYFKRHYTMPRH
jgi:hypothetical protein